MFPQGYFPDDYFLRDYFPDDGASAAGSSQTAGRKKIYRMMIEAESRRRMIRSILKQQEAVKEFDRALVRMKELAEKEKRRVWKNTMYAAIGSEI